MFLIFFNFPKLTKYRIQSKIISLKTKRFDLTNLFGGKNGRAIIFY